MVSLSLNTDIIKLNNDDDYMTPNAVWDSIKHLIPKDKIIWECFFGDGQSGEYLRELGFEVIHEEIDFFDNNKGDILISNPPFSIVPKILDRLFIIDKPFIMILPASKICTNYFRKYKDKKLQIIIPRRRIQFIKNNCLTNRCNFDCYYYCYNINLENDIIWLE